MNRRIVIPAAAILMLAACGGGNPPDAVHVLFVGNSYTFGRGTAALQYNIANVTDMTAGFNTVSPQASSYPIGTGVPPTPCKDTSGAVGCYSPKPWGGVPGIFKALTDEAGLNYIVSHSTRSAATLRGHFLNTADAAWDLRGNIASKKWDVVVLQGQSDEPLPRAKSKNGNPVSFTTYANQIAQYIHSGDGGAVTEAGIFGSLANCTAAVTATPPGAGLTANTCNTSRTIPVNVFANPQAKIYLMQTWARPDMVEAHKCVDDDKSTMNGAPMVDPTCGNGSNGSATTGMNNLYYTAKATTQQNLADMTADLYSAFTSLAGVKRLSGEARYAGVLPVGNAFQQGVNSGAVKGSGFYKADGTYDASGTKMNLWFLDNTHASVYGYYLSALVSFGMITGLDPSRFGGLDRAAADLAITRDEAKILQGIAKDTLVATGVALR